MLQITLRYIPISSDVSFLAIKQDEVTTIPSYLTIFYIHVYSAIFTLLFGVVQFVKITNQKIRKLHRLFGQFYFYITVFLAAPSGIYIGFYANGEVIAKTAFVILGILWWFFTVMAVIKIKQKDIRSHRNFMLRGYALAISALTLRAWKVILVYLFHPAPMDVYQIIAWLGFVPNLILIEYYIYHTKHIKL
ncbi:DUF2306 domain-containing protein [Empedobacter brevis]|uniref:DUF2306 domain-containing protein n=1 Tax=Empedobacter brevis TaxID=247 RepID=UPI00289ECB64|nr:DUF2306 domain-containing protein [Empedobacter brevis]